MKESTLYNIIEDAYKDNWREKFNSGEGSNLFKAIKQNELNLSENLTAFQKDELKQYGRAWENYYESLLYSFAIEILHTGIKIGMEIENSKYID